MHFDESRVDLKEATQPQDNITNIRRVFFLVLVTQKSLFSVMVWRNELLLLAVILCEWAKADW